MSKGIYYPNCGVIVEAGFIPYTKLVSCFTAGKGFDAMDGTERIELPSVGLKNATNCYAIQVSGESMVPRILHGDYVLVDPTINHYKGGDIVAVCLNGDYIIKIYDPGVTCLHLSSFNSEFEPIRVFDDDECIILGKCLQVISSL